MTRRVRRQRGLSLVEVVVAVALLGVGISACVACVGSATRASQRAEEFTAVQLLARERLAQIELQGADTGEDQGDFGPERPGYGWRTVTSETDVPGLLQVRLTILWGNPDQPRKAEFTTLIRRPTAARRAGRSMGVWGYGSMGVTLHTPPYPHTPIPFPVSVVSYPGGRV